MLNYLFTLGVYVVMPAALARFVARGAPMEIVQAFGVWLAILVVLGAMIGGAHGAGFGWAGIFAMFTTWIAVPLITLALKLRARRRTRPAHGLSHDSRA